MYQAYLKEPLEEAVRWSNLDKLEENLDINETSLHATINQHFDMSLQWLPKVYDAEPNPVADRDLKKISGCVFRNQAFSVQFDEEIGRWAHANWGH